ncbi:hypothetical protein [Caballeronia sp. LZ034LL]|uniref:hypothetical protein n=1 Tax=Caballeronia sp. LZ034LL TaxID=3038567 RepID=UPI0028581521|nr:hypothetical protein [Caballeronia sp. LZ034LL]MDR5833323.1 hypothetical protein [Caballeronia sp. LZ034LL]
MRTKAGVVNVFATPYEDWSKRDTTTEEALDLARNKGLSLIEALQVNDKLIETVSTHTEAATRMLRLRVDNGLEGHIDRALDASAEYCYLLDSMPQNVPEALSSYQGEFSDHDWAMADVAIRAHGVEIVEGQLLFHGGRWASDTPTLITSRPFSTSFCPQVALRNAEWRGKAYDAGRVDLMVVCVTQPKTKAYVYSREGDHGNEKEVVFASGARLTRVREKYISDILVSKVTSGTQTKEKVVPAYLVEVAIS